MHIYLYCTIHIVSLATITKSAHLDSVYFVFLFSSQWTNYRVDTKHVYLIAEYYGFIKYSVNIP